MTKTLKIGMPAGSLANASRGGNLIDLLKSAGFPAKGYEKGGPTSFAIASLYGWDGRPQEFGAQLGLNELDIAIAGDDWIKERVLELKLEYNTEIKPEKVQSLKRGGVRIVSIIDGTSKHDNMKDFLKELIAEKKLITVVSEMPYLALGYLRDLLEELGALDKYNDFSVQKYKTPSKIETGIVIYETWGKTEAKIKNGGADLGLEITQTGSAIKNYGLKICDTLMNSETGIWINPNIREDEEKLALLEMFLLNLYGAINAENKALIAFNVPVSQKAVINEYLEKNNLFADEPTVSDGKEFAEYSIQVETNSTEKPIAKIRYDLAKLSAKNIDTIPLCSAIPGIEITGL